MEYVGLSVFDRRALKAVGLLSKQNIDTHQLFNACMYILSEVQQ